MITTRLFNASVHSAKEVGNIAGYYFGREVEGYYDRSGASKAYWAGSALEALGINGRVVRASLFHLLRGRNPLTLEPLVRLQSRKDGDKRKRGQDRAGMDLTFSVPKGVSALWAYLPEKRKLIEDCIQRAVLETLSLIEENCLTVRTGKGGSNWETGKLIFALFQHYTARNRQDFQLHTHCVIPNLVVTKAGKIQKINSKALLQFARVAGPLFRNTLLVELSKNLGIKAYIPRDRNNQSESFEIEGLPQEFLREFSSRRREIEAEVAAFGYSNAHSSATQNANIATRRPKGKEPSMEELEVLWQEKAKPFGITSQFMQNIIGHSIQPLSQKESQVFIEDAIKQITSHEAIFDRWTLIRKTSELLQDKVISGADVVKTVDIHLSNNQELILAQSENHQSIYSLKLLAKMEEETIACVNRMTNRDFLSVDPKHIEKAINRSKIKLSVEQEKCVREVLSSPGAIASIAGHAGAGKTTILRVIVDAYELAGKNVIGTSVGGVAVDKIRESINRESRTFASLLREFARPNASGTVQTAKHHLRMFARAARGKSTWKQAKKHQGVDKNTVFLADESGMIDLLTMHPFLKEIDSRSSGVVFIGDGAQLQPVGPGNPLLHVNTQVNVQELKHNWRQGVVEAKAALNVREGNSEEAIKAYIEKGDLIVEKERASVISRLIGDWALQAKSDVKSSIVIAQTNREVDLLNRLCQTERLKSGAVYGHAVKINDKAFHKNDRVIFRETDHLIGVKNGYRGTIIAVGDDDSLTIKIDGKSGKRTWKERLKQGVLNNNFDKTLVKITPKQAAKLDLRLGYSATTHSFQGSQSDQVFVLFGGKNQDIHLTYVQLSRAVERTRLYIDRMHAGPELSSIISLMKKEKIKQNITRSEPNLELRLKRSSQE